MKTIPLNLGYSTIIDDEDFDLVSQFKWHVNLGAVRPRAMSNNVRGKPIYLHRFLLNAPKGFDVDHANRDSLDNRRANLRLATRRQNNANAVRTFRRAAITSRFKGVSWDKKRKRWTGSGGVNNRRIFLGRFDTEEETARAYDTWAIRQYGEFARINFPV